VTGVFVVADADEGPLEERNDRRQNLLPGKAPAVQIAADATADPGQGPAERRQPVELGLLAMLPVLGVVAILLPATGIPAGRLEVAAIVPTDPHVGPRRRDRERPDPGQRRRIANGPAVVDVAKAASCPNTPDPRPGVGGIAQAGTVRRGRAGRRR
jgi:hypothetical protein